MQINESFYHLQGRDSFVTRKHVHNEVEFIQVVKGEGFVVHDNHSYRLESGHLYIIDARTPHIVNPSDVDGYVRNKVVIEADSFFRFFREIGLESYVKELFNLPPLATGDKPRVDELFLVISRLFEQGGTGLGFAQGYLLELLHEAVQKPVENVPHESDIIQKMLTEISENGGKITLAELADKLHYSKFYLCHIFTEKTGVQLSHYIDEKKNALCIQELQNAKSPISVIAEKCGFANASSFTRFFKNKNGISPLQYRQSLKKKEKPQSGGHRT